MQTIILSKSLRRKPGFTLIELLIVVAIIGILAGIAVPNFLEAQSRAKVGRARADMRSVAIALETYFVDNNHYPWTLNDANADLDGYGNPRVDEMLTVPDSVTTPIAYLGDHIADVFKLGRMVTGPNSASNGRAFVSGLRRDATFMFLNMQQDKYWIDNGLPSFYDTTSWPQQVDQWGQWQMRSVGPTALYPGSPDYPGATYTSVNAIYDPTNGTVSPGQIIRTQKSAEGFQR